MADTGEGGQLPEGKVKVSVKCRPNQLCELIEKLNDAQRAAVRRIGFGGLLELKLRSFPLARVPDFLNAFSDESYVFRASELKEFMVTKYDVYDCFMIPCGPNPVDLVPTGHQTGSQDPENKRLKDRWRRRYNVEGPKDGVNLGVVFKDILDEKYKKGGPQFCRLFVLLAMSSFLAPTSYSAIDFKLLRAVADVKAIPQYDWCSYVLENTAKAAASVGTKKKTMLGCIPFLMIIYFHRFDFRGKSCPHDLPLIKHWDREKLADRLRRELDYSELGRQTWSRVKYPRCVENQLMPIADLSIDNTALMVGDTVAGGSKQLSGLPHKRFIELELPPGVEDDADLKGRALDDVHELYLKMQRNAIVFYNWYSNAAMTLKGLTSGASSSSGSAGTQATQSFFRSQKMKEYALDIEQLAARLKSSTEGAPVLQHDGSGAVDLSDDEDPEDEEEEEVEGETEDETEEEEEEEVEGESEDEDDEEEAVEKEVEVEETYGEEDEEQGEEEEGEEERDGEEVGGDAVELCTQQIMDTVKFYAADEFAETERPLARQMENERDAKSLEFFSSREIKVIYKRRKVVEKPVPVIQPLIEPEMTDDEILHQFYTPEQLDEAYRKAAAMEEARKEQARMENPNDAERGAEGSDQAEPSEKLTIEEACQDQSSTENPIGGHVDSFGDENVACESMFSEPSGTQFLFTTAEINDAERAASGSDQADHAVAEKEIIVQSVGVDSQRPVDTNPELTVADYAAKSPDFTSTPFCSVDIHDAFQGVESPVSADVQQGEHKPGQPKDVSVDQFLDDVVVDQSEEVDGVNLSKITEEIDGGGALLDEAVKSTESDIAVVERKDKEHGDLEVVTPELGVGMNPLECTSTVYSESQLEEAFKGVGDKANVCADLPEGSAARSNPNQDVYVPRSELSHHPFLLHSSAPLSCMEHIMENLGCSIDCGAPNPDLIFATQNLEFSQSLLAPVFELRKYVMDYVFNSSGPFNRWEQLVTFSIFYFITREDLATLVPRQQVMTSVIDGWCLLLNHIMITGPGIISRCFFGLSHTHPARDIWRARKVGKVLTKDEDVFGGWENWAATCSTPLQIDADLIFLPVLSGDGDHYSCACINFLSEQIEYLDVRTYDEDLETLPYGGIARIAANLMGKYLCSKGLSRGAKVSSFKLVNIEFPWQGTGYNENDCGMYMMLAMMFYEGKLFECGLGDEEAMKLFRAEVAATLVLCDINKDRSNVLRRVEAFKEFTGHPLTRKLNAVKRKTSCELEPESIKRARVEEKEPILSVTPVSMRLPVDRALSAVKSQPRGRGDGLGCTIDCGRGGYNTLVVSKFLRNNQALLKGIKTLRKHVADYCLLDDHIFDHREQVVWYGRHAALQRADMLSMAPDKLLSPVVIECWAILLNHLEKEEYGEQARMSFFGIRHMELLLVLLPTFEQKGTQTDSDVDALYQIWDTFIVDSGRTVNLNTDLLFVPLSIDDHLACVCINFRSKTIDLLDHQRYLDVNKTQMGKAARLIGSAMSDYLDARAIARARDIVTFPVRQIYFSGCSPTVNKPESGLFTMMAMLLYEGIPFAHEDLEGKKARRFLVVQLIATLLLADLNVIRESVLLKMKPFIADKDKLWKHLQVQRRNYQGPARK